MQQVNHKEYEKELQKCKKCGECKGVITEDEEDIYIACLCEGVLCRKCEKTMVHKPISNYFDEQNNQIIHIPSFSPCLCAGCGGSKK